MASSSSSYWQKKLLVPGSGEESITQRRNESQDTLWAVPTTKWTRVPGTPRLAQNKLFLLRINIARFNTRKYIKEYFGARYFLKVLNFFIFILFSFFKNNWIFSFFFHLKILRKNLESRVQIPESSPDFILCQSIDLTGTWLRYNIQINFWVLSLLLSFKSLLIIHKEKKQQKKLIECLYISDKDTAKLNLQFCSLK